MIASIAVAVLTATAIAYFATQQGTMFDSIDDALGGDPLLVRQHQVDLSFVIGPQALPATLAAESAREVADQQEYQALLESTRAVPLVRSQAEITIEGNRQDSVIVERISARVMARTEALGGTFLTGPRGAGPEEKITLAFDLDSPDKRARTPDADGFLGEIFDERNYIEIRHGEKLVFTFYGFARQAYAYEWVIDLVVQVGERHETVTVGADAPYTVSGPLDEYAAYYEVGLDSRLRATPAHEMCPDGCVARALESMGFGP